MSKSRRIAHTILRRVELDGAYSSPLLQSLDERSLHPRDVALVTELVYGVLRRARYLDHVLAAFSSRPPEQIDPELRIVLRMGLYQMLFLTRVPAHAAVNEAVELARGPGASGRAAGGAAFVNAVLRAVTRARSRVPTPPQPAQGEDPAPALSIASSHPEWLVRRWLALLGPMDTGLLLEANNRPPRSGLRATGGAKAVEALSATLALESVGVRRSDILDDFLVVTGGVPQRTTAFARGEFYIQDEASGLVGRLAGARAGHRILDVCSAPGGKALYMSGHVGQDGLVVAADLHPARLRLLRDNATRLGLTRCAAVAADFERSDPPLLDGVQFDAVMLDAPCSGTGVIRRNPEVRYRLSPGSLRQMAAAQARLLDRCAPLVRPGGALIYSVCSLEPEEGPAQVSRFLTSRPEFFADDARPFLPDAASGLTAPGDRGGSFLRTLPHRDDLDGFFAARLVRQR